MKNNINNLNTLNEKESSIMASYKEAHTAIRNIESEITDLNTSIKYVEQAKLHKPVWNKYIRSGKSASYHKSHLTELILYEVAIRKLKEKSVQPDDVSIITLRDKVASLEKYKSKKSKLLRTLKTEQQDLSTANKNVEMLYKNNNRNISDSLIDKKNITERK